MDGCKKLLGLTSSGVRVVCGKPTARPFADLCPTHEEFDTAASITCEIQGDLAEHLYERSKAYGIPLGTMIGRMLKLAIAMNLDAPQ